MVSNLIIHATDEANEAATLPTPSGTTGMREIVDND
jgi:hypothetical protein